MPYHVYGGDWTDSNDGTGSWWDPVQWEKSFNTREEAENYASLLNQEDATNYAKVTEELYPRAHRNGEGLPAQNQPQRRELRRGPGWRDDEYRDRRPPVTYSGQLPGAPPVPSAQERIAGLFQGIFRPEVNYAAPGERYVAATDDMGARTVRYKDTGYLLRRLDPNARSDGGRETVLGSANAARAHADLARRLQDTSLEADFNADPRDVRRKQEVDYEALSALEHLSGASGRLTPELAVRVGQFMETLGLPAKEATRLALYEFRLSAAGVPPHRAERAIAAQMQKHGLLDSIEPATEITRQTFKTTPELNAAALLVRPEVLAVEEEIANLTRAKIAAEQATAYSVPGLPNRAYTDARAPEAMALQRQIDALAQALGSRPGDVLQLPPGVNVPHWDDPNDPGRLPVRGPAGKQLTLEETEEQARYSSKPAGGRDPFDREPGNKLEGDYSVPILIGRATEPVYQKTGTGKEHVLDPGYEARLAAAQRNERLAAATKGILVRTQMPHTGYNFLTQENVAGGAPRMATGDRLSALVEAAGGSISGARRSPDWQAAINQVAALAANPVNLHQTPTMQAPKPDRDYVRMVAALKIAAAGDPRAPETQEAQAVLSEALANPQWARWPDSGKTQYTRAWNPASLGVAIVNPTAELPAWLGYSHRSPAQGKTEDGGFGVTGVPNPEPADLDRDGLVHGFSMRDDPGARGYEERPATLAQATQGIFYDHRTPFSDQILDGPTPTVKITYDDEGNPKAYHAYVNGPDQRGRLWQGDVEPRTGVELFPKYGSEPQVNADGRLVQTFRAGEDDEMGTAGWQELRNLHTNVFGLDPGEGGLGVTADAKGVGGVTAVVNQRLTDDAIGEIQNELLDKYLPGGAKGGHRSATWNLLSAFKAAAGAIPDDVPPRLVVPPGSAAAAEVEAAAGQALASRFLQAAALNESLGLAIPAVPRNATQAFSQALAPLPPEQGPAAAVPGARGRVFSPPSHDGQAIMQSQIARRLSGLRNLPEGHPLGRVVFPG